MPKCNNCCAKYSLFVGAPAARMSTCNKKIGLDINTTLVALWHVIYTKVILVGFWKTAQTTPKYPKY